MPLAWARCVVVRHVLCIAPSDEGTIAPLHEVDTGNSILDAVSTTETYEKDGVTVPL